MKTYEIRHKGSNRVGYLRYNPDSFFPYKCSESKDFSWPLKYASIEEAEGRWVIPEDIKRDIKHDIKHKKMLDVAKTIGIWASVVIPIVAAIMFGACVGWDYNTGRDTGYISAVDKMTLTDDYIIYLRRRPLDAQGFTLAAKDEQRYCTTSDYPEVAEKAYEAILSGKRVMLVYDKPREFGWKKFGGCNSAPITDIIVIE